MPVWVPPFHALFLIFAVLAVTTRLVFWLYTGRVWEDSLIALTSARNVWEGFGLTHHASEPRVHSFTSVIGELMLIAGESVRQGLLTVRLVSLVAAVASIYYAYRIGVVLSFHWAAQVLVLGYLATDHLQILFGMAGMETQVATAIILANVYYYLTSQWTKLGIALGLALLTRPEFAVWAVILGTMLLVRNRAALFRVASIAASIALPWAIFAQLYYGSIVPHTIRAKSIVYYRLPFASMTEIRQACLDWWRTIAPFRQYWAAPEAPVPDTVLRIVVALLVSLAAVGSYRAWRVQRPLIAVIASVAAFALYRTLTVPGAYTMWYLPPIMALFFLIAGYGVSMPGRTKITAPIALLVFAFYASHLPFTLPLDRQVQEEIEVGMLAKVGRTLNAMMTPTDTAALEPIGTIGWEARNKTIYDYPGLGSPIALDALMRSGKGLSGMIDTLLPTFAVLRPSELNDLTQKFPETAAGYEVVAHITPERKFTLTRWGLSYWVIDSDFTILKRRQSGSDNERATGAPVDARLRTTRLWMI